ncbi:MAG: NAD(P)/FAD-dependent oxidoreductase [Thermoleophilia bacterium]|nr:NAD(P)/FAD-dependent oxidoreductase [Thermoleophilia bacterium]
MVDVAVIGGGTAGLTAALAARHAGATVSLVEREARLGGDCTFYGCVPSKTLVSLARVAHQARLAADAGVLDAAPKVVFSRVGAVRDATVARIAEDEQDERFQRLGIEVIHGSAALTGRNELDVDTRPVRFRRLVVATGSEPALPDLPGIGELCLTNRTIFRLERLPARLLVLGGGATGIELAQAFARFGSEVTIVESTERLLPGEEPEAGELLAETLAAEGVDLRLATTATGVARREGGVALELPKGRLEGDELLVATGQQPVIQGFGLDRLGLSSLQIDGRAETKLDGVFACGDVTGGLQFTHVASHEGVVAGRNAAGKRARLDERVVPSVIYTDPEIARVGLTERGALERHDGVEALWLPMSRVDRARITGREAGFVKLVTARRRLVGRLGGGELVGATIVGEGAGELIHECALAMRTRAFAGRLAQTIHAYPSLSLGVQQAAAQLSSLGRLLAEGGERRRHPPGKEQT